jgi:hypothetical protein
LKVADLALQLQRLGGVTAPRQPPRRIAHFFLDRVRRRATLRQNPRLFVRKGLRT